MFTAVHNIIYIYEFHHILFVAAGRATLDRTASKSKMPGRIMPGFADAAAPVDGGFLRGTPGAREDTIDVGANGGAADAAGASSRRPSRVALVNAAAREPGRSPSTTDMPEGGNDRKSYPPPPID